MRIGNNNDWTIISATKPCSKRPCCKNYRTVPPYLGLSLCVVDELHDKTAQGHALVHTAPAPHANAPLEIQPNRLEPGGPDREGYIPTLPTRGAGAAIINLRGISAAFPNHGNNKPPYFIETERTERAEPLSHTVPTTMHQMNLQVVRRRGDNFAWLV